jgi:porphobilinogen synthase
MAVVSGGFPGTRMRRMRRDDFSRRLMRESVLTANDFIYPVFVLDGGRASRRCRRCPASSGSRSMSAEDGGARAVKLGIPALALFPVIDAALKSLGAEEAYNAGRSGAARGQGAEEANFLTWA